MNHRHEIGCETLEFAKTFEKLNGNASRPISYEMDIIPAPK